VTTTRYAANEIDHLIALSRLKRIQGRTSEAAWLLAAAGAVRRSVLPPKSREVWRGIVVPADMVADIREGFEAMFARWGLGSSRNEPH